MTDLSDFRRLVHDPMERDYAKCRAALREAQERDKERAELLRRAFVRENEAQAENARLRGVLGKTTREPRWLSIGSIRNQVEVRFSREVYEEARALLAGSPPADEAKHECQRCGSDQWTDVDYSGCSECREPPEPPADEAKR